MNKHFYRIVFNKARGLLMVVADIVKGHQGEGRTGQKVKTAQSLATAHNLDKQQRGKMGLNAITVMTYLTLGWVSVVTGSDASTIVVDSSANKTQRPTVISANNGVTQVNIQMPTSGGVSHNKYSQFDVSDKGLILNNSYQASKTELGGYINGNEFLIGSNGAKIILNEINAKNASQLAGYIEVAGKKAQVIIANAAGITCNGCGFINADRATLTTGKPVMANGQLTGYQVEQGKIAINGKGLDSSRQNYTDIIARTVSINASVFGHDVSVISGQNKVSQDIKQIEPLSQRAESDSQTSSNQPQLAIDVAALGGMYAGKIQMIGTESGVGVHNAGNLGASAGGITITADGKIVNQGAIQAKQDITLISQQNIDNQKQIYSQQNIHLTGTQAINNDGTIVAKNTIIAKANSVKSSEQSTIAAGIDETGKLTEQGDLNVDGNDITLLGQTLATKAITLQADTRMNLDAGTLVADSVAIRGEDISAQSATFRSSDTLTLEAQNTADTAETSISSQRRIKIKAKNIENRGSTWRAEQSITQTATNNINNQHAELLSLADLTQQASNLDNEKSKLNAKGHIQQTADVINNQHSTLVSEKSITLNANTIDNALAQVKAQGSITQQANSLLNNRQSTLVAGQGISLSAKQLIQNQANLSANGLMNITSDEIDNEDAKLLSQDIHIKAHSITGGGSLFSTHDIDLALDEALANRGKIQANNALSITSSAITNTNKLLAGQRLELNSAQLTNALNAEISADNLLLTHQNTENFGLIDGEQVNINSKQLDNLNGARIYGTDLTITTQMLNNLGQNDSAPVIAARHHFNLAVTDTLNNRAHGLLLSLGDFNIGRRLDTNGNLNGSTSTINNHSSTIEAQGNLTIKADTLNNINDNIKTQEVLVDERKMDEWAYIKALDVRYRPDEIREYCVGCGLETNYRELKIIATGYIGTVYNHYLYNQKTYETQVVETEPSKIISGGNLTIVSDKTLNDNSQINAGKQLILQGELENKAVDAIKKITRKGTRNYYFDYYPGKGKHYTDYPTSYAYIPLDEISAIDLGVSTVKDHVTINPTDTDLNGRSERDDTRLNHPDITVGSVSTLAPNIVLPNSSLYTINKAAEKHYLIETDSRFINKKDWLSSDYMFAQLKADPNTIQKRLGDGYYEQQLIKEQVTALTGQRYTGSYQSDLEQYQALMNAGVSFAQRYGLTLGVKLTAEQMQVLTTDMVWMVNKTVTLDGQTIDVLMPQVYVVNRPNVTAAGAQISGKNVTLQSEGNLASSGTIVAKDHLMITANTLTNQGTLQGGRVDASAVASILSTGAIVADTHLSLTAGQDVNLTSTTRTQEKTTAQGHDIQTVIDRTATVRVTNGDMNIDAGHDINAAGALLVNQSQQGNLNLNAGNDLNLSTVTTRDKIEHIASNSNYVKSDATHAVGSEIYSQGNLNQTAKNDIDIKASKVNAEKALNLDANHINIGSQTTQREVQAHVEVVTKGTFNTSKSTYDLNQKDALQNGSALGGGTVNITAEKDITVTGSQVVGAKDINVTAGQHVTLDAAEENHYQREQRITKTSGLMSGGGLGVSIGTEKESTTTHDTKQGYVGSTVGSTEGQVSIVSDKDLTVNGSDIIAKQNIHLQGDNVSLLSNDASVTYKEQYKYEKTGLTLAITGTATDVYDAKKAMDNAKHKDNDKLQALQKIKSALTLANAGLDVYALEQNPASSEASIGVSASFGSQKTEREVNQAQHNVVSSGVSAGENITITASGTAQKDAGDITLKGSEIKAGNDITLDANRDLNVIGAVNTQHSDRDEKSDGGAVGVQFQLGGDDSGFRFKGSANFSRERENADGSAWTQSVMSAGNRLTSQSGHDTNMIGGQLKGGRVKTDVGNNLTIKSLQESDNYDYDKLSGSVSGSGGVGGFSANLALSKTDMASNWASVTEQSGIFAGKGGYDVKVGHNTDLQGAVIASKADDKSNNTLDTGSISFSNIENKADFDVNSMSINIGTSGGLTPTVYHSSGSDHSTTVAAVEQGTLTVRNQDEQKHDVNQLSRDPENANNRLGKIFDRQKELDNIEAIELVKDMAAQAKDITKKYDHLQAQHDVDNNEALVKKQAQDAYAKLSDEDKAKNAFDDYYKQNKDAFYSQAVDEKIKENRKENIGGMGSGLSKGIDAATSIVTGLLTGDITGGLAGASAPYLAGVIKEKTKNPDGSVNTEANLIAHAVLGAAVAIAQGHSGLAGGAGAVTGEAAADIIREQLYGNKNVKDLSEADKENISALAQLAAGLAVAAGSGGNTSDIGTAVSDSKNAIENNELSLPFPVGSGTIQNAGTAQEVVKEVYFKCGDSCTPEDYKKAFQDAGLANRFEQLTEEQRKIIYSIPLAGWVYGGFDAIKDSDITRLLEAGVSQTEIGGFMMMLYRNQPNASTENEVLLRLENLANKGQNKTNQGTTDSSIRFIDNVNVVDIKTGERFTGTVDLKPTLDRIISGEKYPHRNDGSIFQNRPDKLTGETGLPPQPLGYYKEYVHPTPNIQGPGPQRIITGEKGEIYYTNDHYKTFIRIK